MWLRSLRCLAITATTVSPSLPHDRHEAKNSALMKQLMNYLHRKKGQERTLPSSLWMRYKAVEQETLPSP